MTYELVLCTEILLWAIDKKEYTRDDVSDLYALAIQSSEITDWGKVNQAIIKRWSKSGLRYIKERAWKIIEGKVKV